jgi:magnesium transporter
MGYVVVVYDTVPSDPRHKDGSIPLHTAIVVNLTLISVRQNDQTKKISAWAAILIVPTLIAGIYGMNFDFMPELHWTFGYPLALALMVSISVGLYAIFRHVRWL